MNVSDLSEGVLVRAMPIPAEVVKQCGRRVIFGKVLAVSPGLADSVRQVIVNRQVIVKNEGDKLKIGECRIVNRHDVLFWTENEN